MSHRRRFVAIIAVTAVLLTAGSTGAAELASKRYKFSPNQTLTVSLASGPVTVRSVLFEFPSAVMGFRGRV